ncbi:hypothetical protein BDV34DRAFT_199475 [Aspergillus parasiticus]|uniref:Thioesterase domain-containing protein n=1 Tax=Aspergillus parasiticus TaxID=5067 RepID=A0A5N6DGA1_ASPPA|nr:hypothetical protein BDV34DRAFT_199475 [Aspergillus parasiticus]
MPDIKMRITDGSNSEIVLADVVGNLEISGPVVFKSYFNNPTATKESFSSDGWFKTGDKGSIDEIGYLTLQGRAKEVLIINCVKYNPHEIETALDESKIPGLTPSFDCCFSYFTRTRGFNESKQPFQTIAEVVSTYHAAIKKKQPAGPYALTGYLYSSMLIFEVGKILESNGDKVSFLGSFNLPLTSRPVCVSSTGKSVSSTCPTSWTWRPRRMLVSSPQSCKVQTENSL